VALFAVDAMTMHIVAMCGRIANMLARKVVQTRTAPEIAAKPAVIRYAKAARVRVRKIQIAIIFLVLEAAK